MSQDAITQLPTLLEIKERISAIPMRPLEEHCERFDQVHLHLSHLLSEIDGL